MFKMSNLWIVSTLILLAYLLVPYTYVDKRVQAYYSNYMRSVHQHCNYFQYYHPGQVSIKIKPINYTAADGSEQIGLCWKKLNRFEITLDESYWNSATPEERWELVAHEMTHCTFLEGHSTDEKSLMYNHSRGFSFDETAKQLDAFMTKACS